MTVTFGIKEPKTFMTVNSAFNHFLTAHVRLDQKQTEYAKSSSNWLKGQIRSIAIKIDDFPFLWDEFDLEFGSFARKTKIVTVDDIDLMIGLHAQGCTYAPMLQGNNRYQIYTTPGSRLDLFASNSVLNSRKIINKFVKELGLVPQYQQADIKRTLQAATLKLKSYDWNFDIVPCFYTSEEMITGRCYYLIPDGDGNWMKTDPRIEQNFIMNLNRFHGGVVLDVVRLIKYWNRRPTMPSIPSYMLECLALGYFNEIQRIDYGLPYHFTAALHYIRDKVMGSIPDPKGIEGDINKLEFVDRLKIHDRVVQDASRALSALTDESNGNSRNSISTWRLVFGDNFPKYG